MPGMTVQEVCDRAEITDLITRYTRALDEKAWDDFDALFAPGAFIDYTALGGLSGNLAAMKPFLADTMRIFTKTQHMLGVPTITVDNDRATAVTPCHNPMLLGAGEDAKVMVCSLWYHHELVRTPEGWRIARLGEERNFVTILSSGDINLAYRPRKQS